MLNTLEHWDKCATLWINSLHTPASDQIWLFFSAKSVWIPFYVLLLVLLFRRLGWKRALIALAAIALTVVACDQGANLIKNTVCRLRPNKDPWMIEHGVHILEKGGLYGFFSAHAANCFGVAMCASRLMGTKKPSGVWRAYNPVIFTWAALVAASRIFVAKHFLGDVLVGASVGMLFGYILALCGRLLFSRVLEHDHKGNGDYQ